MSAPKERVLTNASRDSSLSNILLLGYSPMSDLGSTFFVAVAVANEISRFKREAGWQ